MFFEFIGEMMGDFDFNVARKYQKYTTTTSEDKERYVYVLKDDKVFKLYISIDEYLIEQKFKLLKDNLNKKDFIYVNYDKFKDNKFPLNDYEFEHSNILKPKYKIPNKNSLNSSLLYVLTDIYNSYMITSDMLNDLSEEYKFRYNECNNIDELDRIWIEVIQDIVNNLEIEIEEEYDYNAFEQAVNFLEDIRDKECIPMIDVLYKLKQILTSAKENKEIFENLKININKEKQLRK